jgi:hypothetical protein
MAAAIGRRSGGGVGIVSSQSQKKVRGTIAGEEYRVI